jgi:hypothetical protein
VDEPAVRWSPVTTAPQVKLGRTVSNGIAPSMFALIERGVSRRPDLARVLSGKVVIRFREEIAPVRITFDHGAIRVEDGDSDRSDLLVTGSLPHVVQLTVTPMTRLGIPDFRDVRGRAALLRVAFGRVRLRGDLGLARRMLEMMAVPAPDGPHGRGARRTGPRAETAWIDVLT